MSDLALRPRSPTELVDAAVQVYRKDPVQFIIATAAVYVPWLVVRLVLGVGISTELPSANDLLVALAGSVVTYAAVGGVISVVASDVYLGRPADAGRAIRVVLARLLPLLAASVLVIAATFLGLLLFILPALYPAARFFAVRASIVLENASISGSFTRSSWLSAGTKRHVLNSLLLALLVAWAVLIGTTLCVRLIPNRVIVAVVSTAVQIVVYPLFGITETLLYYDVRIRKEGFDVEYLARADAVA